ncbi:MAG: glycosyltransferase, partial [Terriglobia bacterium]
GLLSGDCTLALVGNGPDRLRLEALVEELGLGHRVRWMPWVKSNEVAEYMNAFDAMVLPSRTIRTWKEQFGRVLVEAMACETCVVGSDSGEIPNVIGDAGMVFHEGDERELADQLRKLMDDSSLRESIGRRGRERVLQHYTHEVIARDTAAFYEQVCRS